MSPIKKLIDRISGQQGALERQQTLRAFGKLPMSREYLQLEAGEGAAKAFQNWIKDGHDSWIRHVPSDRRGQIVPFRLFAGLPGLKGRVVMACVWKSQDCAAPPRTFPFTSFVVQRTQAADNWVGQFLICDHYWQQLSELLKPVLDGTASLNELPDRKLKPVEDLTSQTSLVTDRAEQINLGEWLQSIVRITHCDDELSYLSFLGSLLDGWREHSTGVGFGVRLPISPQFDPLPQVAAWLRWLEVNVGPSQQKLSGIFLPLDLAQARPAVSITFRPLVDGDFQLLTTNADSYILLEDGTQFQRRASRESTKALERKVKTLLCDRATLWDWANWQY